MKKIQKRKVSLSEKSEILQKIKGSSKVGTQKILSESLALPIPEIDREQHHRDERVTLTLTFSPEEMAILQKAKELSSNATASLEWKDLLVHLARKQIQALSKKSKGTPGQVGISRELPDQQISTAAAAVNPGLGEGAISSISGRRPFLIKQGSLSQGEDPLATNLLDRRCCLGFLN